MDRRAFISALGAAAAFPFPAAASVGLPASPDLVAAFRSVPGITEGKGPGTLHVLFAPWCRVSPSLYRDTRSFLDALAFHWIPFSGGQPEGSEATERLLSNPFPSSLASAFTPLRPLAARPSTPKADAQDAAVYSRIAPLVARDSGGGLVTPTLAYLTRGGRARLIRGGIGLRELDAIASVAAA